MKKQKKCPNCNSTQTRQHPDRFICLKCGYLNKTDKQIQISQNWSQDEK